MTSTVKYKGRILAVETKPAWNKRYYSFDGADTWRASRTAAFEAAQEVVVMISEDGVMPKVFQHFDKAEIFSEEAI